MNWLDVVLLLTIVLSIVSGLRAGFARTGVSFAAFILGLVLGLHYYPAVAFWLRPHLHRSNLANILGFLIIYCGIAILGSIVSGILGRFVRATDLTGIDRLLGAGVGIVRGILLAVLTIWLLMAFIPVLPKQALSTSRLAPRVMEAARRLADASPDDVKLAFRRSYRELHKVLPDNVKDRLATVPPAEIY